MKFLGPRSGFPFATGERRARPGNTSERGTGTRTWEPGPENRSGLGVVVAAGAVHLKQQNKDAGEREGTQERDCLKQSVIP